MEDKVEVSTTETIDGSGAINDTETPEIQTCKHQWLIDSPAGPSSKGVCRSCGEKREFMNYVEGSSWGYDISLEQLSGGSRIPATRGNQTEKILAEDR